MKRIVLVLCMIMCQSISYAQTELVKDIDGDNMQDTVYVDTKESTLVCKLSSHDYNSIKSYYIDIRDVECSVSSARNGFYFSKDWMRSGYKCQFRYDNRLRKIQLIGMSRYEFGGATNDGSGKSSVNLLNNRYVGEWKCFDELSLVLLKIPTIKQKMELPVTYLSSFDDEISNLYLSKCSELYSKNRKLVIKR